MPIKPCPFCGFEGCEVDGRFDVCAVECLQCWARGPESTYDECVEMWNGMPRKTKMTKELPTKVGFYYWCGEDKQDTEIVEVESSRLHNGGALYVDCCEAGLVDIDRLGGYWAKVDKDQFEFVD